MKASSENQRKRAQCPTTSPSQNSAEAVPASILPISFPIARCLQAPHLLPEPPHICHSLLWILRMRTEIGAATEGREVRGEPLRALLTPLSSIKAKRCQSPSAGAAHTGEPCTLAAGPTASKWKDLVVPVGALHPRGVHCEGKCLSLRATQPSHWGPLEP